MTATTAPYGSWRSPISPQVLSQGSAGIAEPQVTGQACYWLEARPQERGRNAVVAQTHDDGKRRDVLPAPLNARSTVNEYGGGSYCIGEPWLYFVLYDDQRVYRLNTTAQQLEPEPLTPDTDAQKRYGDLYLDPHHQRLLAVCEDHSGDGEPATYLVAIATQPSEPLTSPQVLAQGQDFYAAPRPSPDGRQLVWLAWNHPNMPWDACECWLATVNEAGVLEQPQHIAGQANESLAEPRWSPGGELYLVSDRSNWWNLYRFRDDQWQAVLPYTAEFTGPQWVFGLSSYAFINDTQLLCCLTQQGQWQLATLDLNHRQLTEIATGLTDIGYIRHHPRGGGVLVGANSQQFQTLYHFVPQQGLTSIASAGTLTLPHEALAAPQAIEFSVDQGKATGYGFFYPPTNGKFQGPVNQRPPLLVFCHGGPTGAAKTSLNLKIQYWTSRGFAVADVNYGGSTGYGRAYRNRLRGQWGLVDVQDAVDCVRHLVAAGQVDGERVAIRGSSAGGYTVLAALTFTDTFKAGASLYGIGDLETLAADTHKFESRYLDSLVGPYPQQRPVYVARSPIHHVAQLNCPVIFLQGLKDKIVPPNQAEAMVQALDDKQIPVAYVTFAEEGHGFRQADNIRRSLEAELYFYSQVFNFPLAEPVEPVRIRHLAVGAKG